MGKDEYIKREDAIKQLIIVAPISTGEFGRTQSSVMSLSDAIKAIKLLPAAPVREVRKGKWVWKHRSRGGLRRVTGIDDYGETHTIEIDERREVDDPYCPKCGKLNESVFLNFCPNCGASMTEEREPTMEEFMAGQDLGSPEDGSL